MAEKIQKTINTRIVLRNDELAKWNASTKPLLKGEAALALRTDGNYELRFGASDSLSTWSMLEDKGQLIVPAKNVEFLTYDEYRLSSLGATDEYQAQFQLQGKSSKTQEWANIGSPIQIPVVDFEPVYQKIEDLCADLSGEVEALSDALSGEIDALSTSLSTSVDTLVSSTKTDILNEVNAVSAETLLSAAADATGKAAQALADAKTYVNAVSTDLSTDYQGKIDDILNKIKDGTHFVGKVFEIGVEDGKGFYQKTDNG